MAGADEGLWRTLARLYTAIIACGVCIPPVTALPLLVGIDSFFALLAFGGVGLGIAGGVIFLVDAQLAAAERLTAPVLDAATDTDPPAHEAGDPAQA